ncbi:hypothetical protein FPRO04_09987 [Fusarium proliferatum]|nr:hypothetical protein FPRO04_09987 [Fusarium proliferatum]
MVALKKSLALLFITAVSAIPTSAQWPKYNATGQLKDLAFDRRAPGHHGLEEQQSRRICILLNLPPKRHITNKLAAAMAQTLTAKEPKAVPHMVTKCTASYIAKKQVTTVYYQVTTMATDFKTLTMTDRNPKSITQRKSATVTKPVKVTVTNYKAVIVTNYNTVGVTNRNTVHTTNYNTASATADNSAVVTNMGYATVAEYDTVVATDIATETMIPDPVTVDSYVWGS